MPEMPAAPFCTMEMSYFSKLFLETVIVSFLQKLKLNIIFVLLHFYPLKKQ